VTGAPAREVPQLQGEERHRVVLDAMGAMLAPEAASPRAYRDFNWVEERWSRGGPVGLMGPGTLTTLGPVLRAPAGRIHWAGTETATSWPGYMEGAIQAGERAAFETAR
jgi:monoamine oxidase